jgi:two-component sensor histidine kinase
MAAQTARSIVSPELFLKTFEARVIALSKTHNVLTNGHWESADLRELLKQELNHFGESRICLSGTPVRLKARSALTLGMTFHELATNAAKYGALSIPAGAVTVTWAIESESESHEPSLRIRWTEQGGPKVQDPTRRGFGSRLIERAVRDELDGFVHISFRPEGLHCILEVPVHWTEAV